MKNILTTLALILLSVAPLAAQIDTIATFKVDNSDDVVLSSKDDGVSINIAGYNIALGAKKESDEQRYKALILNPNGLRIDRVDLEEDGVTIKKQKKSSLSFASNSKLGIIALSSPDYSAYGADDQNFLDLRNGKSIYFGLNLVGLQLPIDNSGGITLKTGINLMCYNFTFADNITLEYQDNMITPTAIDSSVKKSKLATTYVAIPLSLSIQLAKKLSIEPGVYAGILVNSHTKYKKPKVKSDYLRGVNQAVAGASLSIDYDDFGLYCDYNLTTLFDEGRGPETKALTVGITFTL